RTGRRPACRSRHLTTRRLPGPVGLRPPRPTRARPCRGAARYRSASLAPSPPLAVVVVVLSGETWGRGKWGRFRERLLRGQPLLKRQPLDQVLGQGGLVLLGLVIGRARPGLGEGLVLVPGAVHRGGVAGLPGYPSPLGVLEASLGAVVQGSRHLG